MLYFPRLNLIVPWANSAGIPIARRTWDAWSSSDEQAEPELTAIPFMLSERRIDSPSTYLKVMLDVPGSLGTFFPFITISGILTEICSSK